jgi:hypothetical protein
MNERNIIPLRDQAQFDQFKYDVKFGRVSKTIIYYDEVDKILYLYDHCSQIMFYYMSVVKSKHFRHRGSVNNLEKQMNSYPWKQHCIVTYEQN